MRSTLQKNDEVKILCGKDKGKISTIIHIAGDKVLVKGVNIYVRHRKPTKNNPEGGILKKETYLHKSNVILYSKDLNSVSRVGFRTIDNKKIRYFKKNGKAIS